MPGEGEIFNHKISLLAISVIISLVLFGSNPSNAFAADFTLNLPDPNGLTITGPRGITIVDDDVNDIHKIFVANQIANTISVLDLNNPPTVLTTIENVFAVPQNSVYVANNQQLYVVTQAGLVYIINAVTNGIVGTIDVGSAPFGIAYNTNNDFLYVTNVSGDSISVIDTMTDTVFTTIDVPPGPVGVKVHQGSNKIYIGHVFSPNVTVIDGNFNAIVGLIFIGNGGEVGINEADNEIYVASSFVNKLSIIDGDTGTVIQTITVDDGLGTPVLDTTTNRILIPSTIPQFGEMFFIDADTFVLLGSKQVGSSPSSIAVNPSNGLVYVSSFDTNELRVLDTFTNLAPTVNAGPDQIVPESSVVQLEGSGADIDGNLALFQWTEIDATGPVIPPTVALSSANVANPTFTAPSVNSPINLQFVLNAIDALGNISFADLVIVSIQDTGEYSILLNSVGDGFEGNLSVELPANRSQLFEFTTPDISLSATVAETKLTSTDTGSVDFNFIIDNDVQQPGLNSIVAVSFEISATGLDLTDGGVLSSTNLPKSKFLVDKGFTSDSVFPDGCPAVDFFIQEDNDSWTQLGNPILSNSNQFYVLNRIANNVSVIDGTTNSVIKTIDVGESPIQSVFVPGLNKLYVANQDSHSVSVIDTISNTVTSTIFPIIGAVGLDYDSDNNEIYVTSFGTGDITIIDASTDTVSRVINQSDSGALVNVIINPELDLAYVVNVGAIQELLIYDLNDVDAGPVSIPLLGSSIGMAFNPITDKVYLSQLETPLVYVIDGQNNNAVSTITVDSGSIGIDVNTLTNQVYVASNALSSVTVIDGFTNVVTNKISLPSQPWGVKVHENMDRVLVSGIVDGQLSILDGTTLDLLGTITMQPGIAVMSINDLVPNPVRDPVSDVLDGNNAILECAYIAEHPHFSKFAIGGVALALGGVGGGSGGSAPITSLDQLITSTALDLPSEVEQMVFSHDSSTPISPMALGFFENFDYPLIINDKGFVLSGFSTTLETQTLQTNTPVTIIFTVYEAEKIQHFSLYTNLRDANSAIHQSDTQILYNDGQEIQIVDPNGFFEDVSFTLNEIDDLKKQIVLEITFAKAMDTSHIITRIWDPNLFSRDTHILDAIKIVSDIEVESPISTSPEPEVLELQSQSIPIWIKNNAAWWSDQQISDSDFVSGIEYLIKNGIINVPGVEIGTYSTSTEIPDWIKNNAGWWSESLITDGDFTEAMQWLIVEGVIQI